jgi:hypothetical protein
MLNKIRKTVEKYYSALKCILLPHFAVTGFHYGDIGKEP